MSDEAKGAAIALMGSATVFDFDLLEKLPKGALVTIIVACAGALAWFVKRDLKKLGDKNDHVQELRDQIVTHTTEIRLMREELRIVSEKVLYRQEREIKPDGDEPGIGG